MQRTGGVECTGPYGAALARHLAARVEAFEVSQPARFGRRRRGKNDAIDAAARAVLAGRAAALAKADDGPVVMLRMFKLAKTSAVKSRTQAINQFKAVSHHTQCVPQPDT